MENTTKQLLTTIAENQPKIKEVGYNEGFNAGKKAEYDAFWDSYQDYGKRRYYKNAFSGNCWNVHTFKPKYDIIDTAGQNVFQESLINVDLREHLKGLGVKLDTSGVKYLTHYFYSTHFSALPEISAVSATAFDYCFYNSRIKTIDNFILKEDGSQTLNTAFNGARVLENITIEGTIGTSISFAESPLSVESLKSIITHLKDYAGTEYENTYTVTFKSSAFEALEAEDSKSPNGNTWSEYIDDIKWNLVLA